jgi:hypothetical protein
VIDEFSRRVLLCLDAKGYGTRDDRQQDDLQHDLVRITSLAASRAGLERSLWDVQYSGDGALAVLPSNVPESRVIDDFTRQLSYALADHNHDRTESARLRLRLAIHQGLVRSSAAGFAGQGPVSVARMADSEPVRAALLAFRSAHLVVILSASLFTEVVTQRHTRLAQKDFREVRIKNKTFTATGWLHVPGHDVHELSLEGGPVREDASAKRVREPDPNAAMVTHIHNGVHGENVVFGIQNRFER